MPALRPGAGGHGDAQSQFMPSQSSCLVGCRQVTKWLQYRTFRAVTAETEGAVGDWRKHPTHLEGQAVDAWKRRGAGRSQETDQCQAPAVPCLRPG